jgi:nucleotide-binding universal stress UspA family protein
MVPEYIVGYDGGAASRAALEFTRVLARHTGADVMATYVYATLTSLYTTPFGFVAPSELYAETVQEGRIAAEQRLEPVPEGVQRRAVPSGSVPMQLHGLARAEHAALLAVGATHRGALGRLVPGSIGERLVHAAPCPVLVVPQTDRVAAIETIAVAYDGRRQSRRALRAAQALAWCTGARLRLIAAIDPWPSEIDLPRGIDELGQAFGQHIDAVLERAATGLRARGFAVETHAERGAPGPSIVRRCEHGVDLLVTGSRGYGPLRTVLLGGASRHMVDHAPCPVLVVARGVSTTLVSDDVVAALSVA